MCIQNQGIESHHWAKQKIIYFHSSSTTFNKCKILFTFENLKIRFPTTNPSDKKYDSECAHDEDDNNMSNFTTTCT
jgi:hypothetical protein